MKNRYLFDINSTVPSTFGIYPLCVSNGINTYTPSSKRATTISSTMLRNPRTMQVSISQEEKKVRVESLFTVDIKCFAFSPLSLSVQFHLLTCGIFFFLIMAERWRKVCDLFSFSMFLNLIRTILFNLASYSARRSRVHKFDRNKAKWIILC